MILRKENKSNPMSVARQTKYGQRQNKRRGCFGTLKIRFHHQKEYHNLSSLIVNVKENVWVIFTQDSSWFEENSEQEGTIKVHKVKNVPQEISFTYHETQQYKDTMQCTVFH